MDPTEHNVTETRLSRSESLSTRTESALDKFASSARQASEKLLDKAGTDEASPFLDQLESLVEIMELHSKISENMPVVAAPADLSESNVLLLSTAQSADGRYLTYAEDQIKQVLGDVRKITFVPYALADRDAYQEKVTKFFNQMGIEVESVHTADDPVQAIQEAEAVFVGGGNTFRLLKELHSSGVLTAIRTRVETEGLPYIGASAGSNVAMHDGCTTNDMPIEAVAPSSLIGLHLLPFNLNPHFPKEAKTPVEGDKHLGESRSKRITQYLEEQPEKPVLCLEEGAGLSCIAGRLTITGGQAHIMEAGKEKIVIPEGTDLTDFYKSCLPK